MTITTQVINIFSQLHKYEFIRKHGFEGYLFSKEGFFACASTLQCKNGRKITASFNIHQENPEEIELVMQFPNKASLEQIRVIYEQLSRELSKTINIYEESDCISAVSYYRTTDLNAAVDMLQNTLKKIKSVTFYIIN